MSNQNLTHRSLIGIVLILFLGGGFMSASLYWIQQYDYVVKINKIPVRTGEYTRRLEQNRRLYPTLQDKEVLLKSITLNQLIERELYLQAAQRRHIQVEPEAVEVEWQQILHNSYQGDSENMLRSLLRNGYTEHSFRKELKTRLRIRQLQDALTAQVQVPEAKLRQYYQEHLKDYQHDEQIEASHILFKVDPNKANSDSQAKAKAEKVLKEIQAGLDFASAAQKYSEDGSNAKNGGSLGSFGKGDMVKPFETAAWALKPGELTPTPVKTQYGYHLIKRGKTIPAGPTPFDKAKSIFEPRLKEQEKQEYFQKWLAQQRQSAAIEIRPAYQPQLEPPQVPKSGPKSDPKSASPQASSPISASPEHKSASH